jgi:MFS family permease
VLSPFLTVVFTGMVARLGYQMARSPVLPRFAQDLGAAPELIGLIVAASTITGVLCKLPAGGLSDVLGRRQMMVLGCLFFAGPPFLYPLISHAIPLLLLRFLHGLATAIFAPVAAAYVADLSQRDRGEKLGWFASASDAGATVGPLLGGIILFSSASYSITYLVVGALGILPLLMVLQLPDEERPRVGVSGRDRWQQFRSGIVEVASNRAVIVASMMEASMYVGYGAFLSFFPLYARGIGLNDAEIGIVLGAQLGTTMAAKPLSGRLSDRLGRKPMILFGLALCAAVLPVVPLARAFVALLVCSAALGLGIAIVTPSTTALVADLARAGRMGSAMGVFGTIWDSGEASGPIIAGVLVAALGYGQAFSIIAAILAAAALVFAVTVADPERTPTRA